MELIVSAAEESQVFAVDEVRAVLGAAARVRPLGRGVLGVETGLGAREAAARMRHGRSVFVRHQVPVDAIVEVSERPDWVAEVTNAALALLAGEVAPDVPTGVQIRDVAQLGGAGGAASRRAVLWRHLAGALPPEVRLEPRHPERVLSVVLGAGEAWLGLASVGLHLSAWAGGERHFAHRGEAASRAEYKLREAVESFDVRLIEGARAVDLGASPGGWTRALAEAGLQVDAVDPARLDPDVLALRGVRHHRERAEVFVARAGAAGHRFDALVNDMRMDAREAAQLLVGAREVLAAGAWVLTTLKLPKDGFRARLAEARTILAGAFEIVALRQLFHNRSEVTALLRPR